MMQKIWRSLSPSRPCLPAIIPNSRSSNPLLAARGRSTASGREYGNSTRPHAVPGGLRNILRISDEVADAIAANKPVVALESTIYTHGALGNDLHLEKIVRQHGSIPAVCGILDGVPTVGLTIPEVERMVKEGASKVSRRDLAFLAGMGLAGQSMHGGTTIAGTMILARLAGIRVFGTGGLGGVHRGGQDSLDISADLTELGRTRMAVISSGCKGFLDIPRTLEFLETQGVLVSTFADGRSGAIDFPAFWARESGVKSPSVVWDERQAAAIIFAQEQLNVESGLLFANPIPQEHAISREDMEQVIGTAVLEADQKGISGSRNTPYILTRIRELTQGRSVPANKFLVQANVARASKVAVELSKLLSGASATVQTSASSSVNADIRQNVKTEKSTDGALQAQSDTADILVAGSVALDLSCDYIVNTSRSNPPVSPILHTSNPSIIRQSIGGVGHNVALAAQGTIADIKVRLCSVVGSDVAGSTILSSLQASGLDTSCVRQLHGPDARTAQYVAVNDGTKNLVLAMADMAILESSLDSPAIASGSSLPSTSTSSWPSTVLTTTRPRWLVVDANWSAPAIHAWLLAGRAAGARTAFEPVSAAKSARLFESPATTTSAALGVFPNHAVDLTTPNALELAAMHAAARSRGLLDSAGWFGVVDALGLGSAGARDRFVRAAGAAAADAGVPQQSVQLLPFVPCVVAKMGAEGALLTQILAPGDARLFDPEEAPFVLSRGPPGHPHVGGLYMRMFGPAERVREVVSVNGVGDTFLGVLVAGLAKGGSVERLMGVAQKGAVLTLASEEAVSPALRTLDRELMEAVNGVGAHQA